jgi:anti-sigma factor (TIGR02949 family)
VSKREELPTHTGEAEHDDIGCLVAIEMFYAYLDGELTAPREIEDFEKHLVHCRSCFTRAEMENLLTDRLKTLAGSHAPERLHSRVSKLMEEF